MRSTLAIALSSALALAGPATAAVSLSDAAGHYQVTKDGSAIRFKVNQITGGGFRGAFGSFSGDIRIDGSDIAHSKVEIVIFPDSVSTGQQRIDSFLRSGAVFDTANEQSITFRSTSVKRTGDSSAVVTGRLVARGKSGAESFTVSLDSFAKGVVRFHVTGRVKRSTYGMDVGTPIYANYVDFDMAFTARRR